MNKVADKYTSILKESLGDAVKLPVIPEGFLSSWAQYTIQLKDRATRDSVQAKLKDKGIPSMVYYQKPMHKQQAFNLPEDYGFDCSNTDELCDTVLSLPMHPYMTDEDIKTVADALKEAL